MDIFPLQIFRSPHAPKLRRRQTSSPAFRQQIGRSSSTSISPLILHRTTTLFSSPPYVPIPTDLYHVSSVLNQHLLCCLSLYNLIFQNLKGFRAHLFGTRITFQAWISKPPQFGFSHDALIY